MGPLVDTVEGHRGGGVPPSPAARSAAITTRPRFQPSSDILEKPPAPFKDPPVIKAPLPPPSATASLAAISGFGARGALPFPEGNGCARSTTARSNNC